MNETKEVVYNGMVFQKPTTLSTWRYLGGGGSSPKLPPAAPPAQAPVSASQLEEADDKERTIAKKRKGRRSTILNEPTLGDSKETQRVSVLGNTGV